MKIVNTLSAVLFMTLLSVSANAAHISVLTATIDADQAGTMSDGIGAATMTFNSDTNEFLWFVAWQGLSGPLTAAHFHGPADFGVNAGVQVPIDFSSNPAQGSAILTANQASDLLNGLWYINLHTAMAPGGEIRGQVLQISPPAVVPVPAAIWLMLTALSGLGFWRRKV